MQPVLTTAVNKNEAKAIVMVAYEQGWLDSKGTLAMKNNTNDTVVSVSYQLTYLDTSGNPLDYKDFTSGVEIAPGKTRKVNIPAYESERHYSYYKSEAFPVQPHRFKLSFKLVNYEAKGMGVSKTSSMDNADSEDEEAYGKIQSVGKGKEASKKSSKSNADNRNKGAYKKSNDAEKDKEVSKTSTIEDDVDDGYEEVYDYDENSEENSVWTVVGRIALVVFAVFFFLGVVVGVYVLVAVMAKHRNRSVVGWLIVSFFLSPLLTIVILLCVGKANKDEEI